MSANVFGKIPKSANRPNLEPLRMEQAVVFSTMLAEMSKSYALTFAKDRFVVA